MTPLQVAQVKRLIQTYLKSDTPYPYFVSVDGSSEYNSIVIEYTGFSRMCVSDYCEQEDSFPNIDRLMTDIKKLDCDCVLYGVGESIELGCNGSRMLLGALKDLPLPHKLIVLCRGIRDSIRIIDEADPKFNDRRFAVIESPVDYYVVRLAEDIPRPAEKGFKRLLSRLETGPCGEVVAKSNLPLANVKEIRSSYMMLYKEGKVLQVNESALPNECWRDYLKDDSLDGYGVIEWRTYLRLLLFGTDSPYLKLVISKSPDYGTYKKMLVLALLTVDESDSQFDVLYEDRKILLKAAIDDGVMAQYVAEAKQKGAKRIYYLTDMTQIECKAIVEDIANHKVIPGGIERIYPALADYLHDYIFTCESGQLFTEYFSKYKRLKLLNDITPEFEECVVELAEDGNRAYNTLEAKNAIIERAYCQDAFLYWVDALGVEYLGYIQQRAQALGLSMCTEIGRASLPTLTYLNRGFYDGWAGEKCTSKQLDQLKHGGEEGPDSKTGELPIHIVKELLILDHVLSYAQQHLMNREYSSIVIASDHGASRLAVTKNSENKWAMQTKGEHAGRCCPCNEIDERPSCSTEENGYWVLANYDRFKGSRKACVEVHGGASLEEVLVPVIILTLKNTSIEVRCLTDVAYSSYNENPTIMLFSITPLKNLTVQINGKAYRAVPTEEMHYRVRFDDISRIGTYTGDVYEGDNLVGEITFTVQKRTAKTIGDDWFDD